MQIQFSAVAERNHIPTILHVTMNIEDSDLIEEDTLGNPFNLLSKHFKSSYHFRGYHLTYIDSARHNQNNSWTYTAIIAKDEETNE